MSRTLLVTGGSGGIGRAICEAAADGWNVAVHYHEDEAAARATVDAVEDRSGTAEAFAADITDAAEATRLVESVAAAFGSVDALVNNAGVFYDAALLEYDEPMYDRTFAVNMDGAYHCSRAAIERMLDTGMNTDGVAGRIVAISSTAGTHGGPKDAVYAASKGALVAFTKSLARVYAESGILANVISPGPTDTGMLPAARQELAAEAIPIGRIANPTEIAEVVETCLETTFMTGQVIEVNGGLYT